MQKKVLGTKQLSSGNSLTLYHSTTGSRGAIHGEFLTKPTPADLEECERFTQSKADSVIPPGAKRIAMPAEPLRQEAVNAMLDQFMMGSSRN